MTLVLSDSEAVWMKEKNEAFWRTIKVQFGDIIFIVVSLVQSYLKPDLSHGRLQHINGLSWKMCKAIKLPEIYKQQHLLGKS